MPKPPQSTTPHHLSHALNPQKTVPNPHCASYPSATPHTSISPSSVPSFPDFVRFAFFVAQVSVPYFNTLWTQALYIFPFMRYDAPRAVRIGNNSLNLAQAHLTLALAASSTPPPAPSVNNMSDKHFIHRILVNLNAAWLFILLTILCIFHCSVRAFVTTLIKRVYYYYYYIIILLYYYIIIIIIFSMLS